MTSKATPRRDSKSSSFGSTLAHRSTVYQRVFDGRKQPIRGLWIRNGNYYARLNFADPQTGARETRRVRLTAAHTLPQAQAELRRLQTRRETEELPVLRRCPKFSDYVRNTFTPVSNIVSASSSRWLMFPALP